MTDKTCRWARPRLPLLAGGELTGEDRRRAERHLILCSDCRARLDGLMSTVGLLRSLPELEASAAAPAFASTPSLWPEVARQIREDRHPALASTRLRPWAWGGLAMAASVLGLAFLGPWLRGSAPDGSASSTLKMASRPPRLTAPPSLKTRKSQDTPPPATTVADASSSPASSEASSLPSRRERDKDAPAPAGRISNAAEATH